MKVNPIYLRYVVEGLSNQSLLPVPEHLPHGLEALFEDWVQPCQRHGTGAMHILWAFAAFLSLAFLVRTSGAQPFCCFFFYGFLPPSVS